MLWKNPQNYFFIPDPLHCEIGIWNMKIFAFIFPVFKYLKFCFNSSPRFYSHPACRLLELQLIFCKFSCCRRMCSTHTQKSQNLIKHRGLLRWRFSLSLHLVRLSENLHLGLSFWFQLTWPAVSLEECQERIENVCGHLLAIYKIGCHQDTQTFTGKRNIHK